MGLRDLFRNKRSTDVEVEVSSELLSAILGGPTITKNVALQIPEVSNCVDFIAGTIASLPIRLVKEMNGVTEYVTADTRIKLLNDETNDTLDAFQMKKAMVVDYFTGKGGFAYIGKTGIKFTSLHYIDESKISSFKNTDPIYKDGYYQVAESGETIYPYQVIKLLRNTKDGLSGKSIISEVAKALETAYNGITTQNKIFRRDGMKKGFLEAESVLTEAAATKLKSDWQSLYTGADSTILLNKGLKFNPANMSVQEMQLIEARRLLDEEIKNIFHIKDTLADTYNCALKPIIRQFETALNSVLLLESEKLHYSFHFDAADIFTATAKERYEAYNTAINGGYMSINEVREKEHMNKVEGLDLHNLGLSSALFDPKTQKIIIPNMSQSIDVNGGTANKDENVTKGEGENDK